MSIQRQIAFWLTGLAGLGLVLHLLGGVVTPFAMGIVLGYLLDPIVRRLSSFGIGRLGASIIILIVFVVILAAIFVILGPILGGQLVGFIENLPSYVTQLRALVIDHSNALLNRYGGAWQAYFGLGNPISSGQIQKSAGDLISQAGQIMLSGARSLLSGGAALVSIGTFLVITPVVAFYMLLDWDRMLATVDGWLPLDHREALRQIAREINHSLAGFLRGQLLVCLSLALWCGIGLTLIGLDFGFLIGVVGGMLSFIPYVGSLFALVAALVVAIVQGWPNWGLFLMALAIVGSGQFLEGYVLGPRLVGNSVGLHPVWLMFALVAFGDLFGFTDC
jgi:predicted PurR-regulated permease PerM